MAKKRSRLLDNDQYSFSSAVHTCCLWGFVCYAFPWSRSSRLWPFKSGFLVNQTSLWWTKNYLELCYLPGFHGGLLTKKNGALSNFRGQWHKVFVFRFAKAKCISQLLMERNPSYKPVNLFSSNLELLHVFTSGEHKQHITLSHFHLCS